MQLSFTGRSTVYFLLFFLSFGGVCRGAISMGDAFYEDPKGERFKGAFMCRPKDADGQVAMLHGSRAVQPITLMSVVDVNTVLERHDGKMSIPDSVVDVKISPDAGFLQGDLGKLVRASLPDNLVRTAGDLYQLTFTMDFVRQPLPALNICLSLAIQCYYDNLFLKETGPTTVLEFLPLHDKKIYAQCTQEDVRQYAQDGIKNAALEHFAQAALGVRYKVNFRSMGGLLTEFFFVPKDPEQEVMSELLSRKVLGNMVAVYAFYTIVCHCFFTYSISPAENPLLRLIDSVVSRYARAVLEKGSEWAWVTQALRVDASSVVGTTGGAAAA